MISGSQHGGRRRSLDAEINLVPFIDLLSMCICFLLMTAVWLQIGTLQVKQSHGTDAPQTVADSLDFEVAFKGPAIIEGALKQKSKVFYKFTATGATPSEAIEKFKTEVSLAMDKAGLNSATLLTASHLDPVTRAELAKKVSERVATGMIKPAPGVNYGELVAVMDVLRGHLISNLGVVPVKEGVKEGLR